MNDVSRCPSIMDGFICPDDICRNAGDRTLCGAWIDDMEPLDWEDEKGRN